MKAWHFSKYRRCAFFVLTFKAASSSLNDLAPSHFLTYVWCSTGNWLKENCILEWLNVFWGLI